MPDLGFSLAASIIFATGVTSGAAVTGIIAGVNAALLLAPIGLSLGTSAYVAHQARKDLQPVSDPGGLQSILKQAIPPQRLALGTVTTGGALFFYKAKKPYIWMGILLAAHEIDGLDSVYINRNRVFFDSNGFATSVPFNDGVNQYLKASFRRGTLDQAIDPIIAADFPTMPSTFRQRGHATLVIKAHYGFGGNFEAQYKDHKRVYGDQGILQPLTRFRAAKCFDPRAPGHVLGDPSTWSWSDSAAICLARFLTHQWPDTRLVDPSRLDWDQIAAAADECDRWEVSKDGATTFRRHTVNGVVQSTDSPYDVIENMKIAMGGHLILDRAKIYPVVRGRRTPSGTLHMGMLLGGVEYASEPRDRELINIIKPTFIAPDREYQEVEGPVLRREDLIVQDNKPRESSIRGAFVEDHRRMQRIASAALNQARIGRTLTAGATLEALGWTPGKVYRVHLTGPLARCNGLYELVGKEWDDRLRGYRLTLIGYDPTATDFDPQSEQDFTLDEDVLEAEAA